MEGAEAGAAVAAAAAVPGTVVVQVMAEEVTVQWGALQGVAVCHQFVGAAIAGHRGTVGMFLPTIMVTAAAEARA